MFSRSHFRSVEKVTIVSKRIQERKTEEEPSEVKPRSECLISTSLNRGQSSSFGPDASNAPGNPQLDSGSVQRSCGELQRNRNPNPATCSQVWKEDKLSQGSCGKLQRGNLCERSGSCGKLQRNIEIQLEKNYHNLQSTDYKYVEKVFTNLRHKLNRSENDEMFDLRTNVIIWVPCMSTMMILVSDLCSQFAEHG